MLQNSRVTAFAASELKENQQGDKNTPSPPRSGLITRSILPEIVNFTVESIPFQNRLLYGTHSITDIKLPSLY